MVCFSDLETGMIELKSAPVVPAGESWRMVARYRGSIRAGTSELFTRRSNLIRQPALIDYLEEQLRAMSSDIRARPIVVKLLDGIHTIRSLVESENGPLSEETVRKVHGVCAELVPLSSRRLE